jgi:ADP-heptose:LPS heptosyltransferase
LEDRTRHQTDRYLSVLKPLGITGAERLITVRPREDDRRQVTEMLKSHDAHGKKLVGLFFGAGHPTRRWSIERFARLAERLSMHCDLQVLILMGPEERGIRHDATNRLSEHALVVDELGLTSFFAALSLLDVLVCGDTGPAHLAALAGVPMVLLAEKHVPTIFFPLTDRLTVLAAATVNEISVDDVYESVMRSVKDGSQDKEEQ